MSPWPSLQPWLAGNESGSGWCGDHALCRVQCGESSSLTPAVQHSPHCWCDSGSYTSWGRSPCPHTKIVTKMKGVYKWSNSGQSGWFCSPSILTIMWDQPLPACDSVYIHYNVIIRYRDCLKVSLSQGGFLLRGRSKVSSESAITLLSLYMTTTSQSLLKSSTEAPFSPSGTALVKATSNFSNSSH